MRETGQRSEENLTPTVQKTWTGAEVAVCDGRVTSTIGAQDASGASKHEIATVQNNTAVRNWTLITMLAYVKGEHLSGACHFNRSLVAIYWLQYSNGVRQR